MVSYGGRGVSASLLAAFSIFPGFKLTLKAAFTDFAEAGKDSVLELRGQVDWEF